MQSPEESIRLLAPKTDLVIRIINESSIVLKCVEDHSGNWYRGLHKHFGVISHQHPHFPDWLGPLYFEDTSLVGYPLEVIRFPLEPLTAARSIETIKSGMLVKKVFFSMTLPCIIRSYIRDLKCKTGKLGGSFFNQAD